MGGIKKKVSHWDSSGHLSPAYEHQLHELAQSQRRLRDEARAFISGTHTNEEISRELGEAFIETATSGEETESERHERVIAAELGGPFIVSSARREFALGTDESNIAEATREPLPKTSDSDP